MVCYALSDDTQYFFVVGSHDGLLICAILA